MFILKCSWLHVCEVGCEVSAVSAPPSSNNTPCCRYVNITAKQQEAVVLLENPRGKFVMDGTELLQQVALLFRSDSDHQVVSLYEQQDRKRKLEVNGDVSGLHGRRLYAEML